MNQRSWKKLMRYVSVGLVVVMSLGTVVAQAAKKTSDSDAKCSDCQVTIEAKKLLAAEGVSRKAVKAFLAHLTQNDLEGAQDILKKAGMSEKKVQEIMKQMQQLLDKGLRNGASQRLAGATMTDRLQAMNVPEKDWPTVLRVLASGELDDADRQLLEELGLLSDLIDELEALSLELDFNAAAFDAYLEDLSMLEALTELGLEIDEMQTIFDAYYAGAELDEVLKEFDLAAEEFYEALEATYFEEYESFGFSEEELEEFQGEVEEDLEEEDAEVYDEDLEEEDAEVDDGDLEEDAEIDDEDTEEEDAEADDSDDSGDSDDSDDSDDSGDDSDDSSDDSSSDDSSDE